MAQIPARRPEAKARTQECKAAHDPGTFNFSKTAELAGDAFAIILLIIEELSAPLTPTHYS